MKFVYYGHLDSSFHTLHFLEHIHAHIFLHTHTGLIPYNFLCVQSGLMLAELRGVAIFDPASIAVLLLGAAFLLGTVIGLHYLHSKLERNRTR